MEIVGNGVDIIEVKRIKNAIEKYGRSFLRKVFTDRELKKAKQYNSFYQHLAGRFAAKESVFKALSKERLTFKDVEVLNDTNGKPYCSLLTSKHNKSLDMAKLNIHISISHIKKYAVASAIIVQKN